MRELYRDLHLVADIKKKKMEWTVHTEKMDQRWIVKKIFESKLADSRIMRRPAMRWLEDVQKDLWEMKVKRRWQGAVDREEWTSVIKETKGCQRAVGPRGE